MTSVLIANRGEIALRVIRACRVMGLHTIALYSTEDQDALYLRLADETICIGPGDPKKSYLSIPAIISAAEVCGANLVHPGYGFLSENADFAKQLQDSGFDLIGPSPEVIALMGDKIAAKTRMKQSGLTCIPGSEGAVTSFMSAQIVAERIGFPLLLKASAGGGGRGMQVVRSMDQLEAQLNDVQREAKILFNDDRVFMERYLDQPRHIEFQVLADKFGNVVCLGERDCSIQRRHQKIIEEAAAFGITRAQRQAMMDQCIQACKAINYEGVGTFEFLYEGDEFYFIEMNTRIQVEHPVTEMVTGIDLIEEQIKVFMGESLSIKQSDIKFKGHAIECRINAEDPKTMMPSPGIISDFHAPSGPGVRVDSHIYSGYRVPHHYDSMVAKIIVHGHDRQHAIRRMLQALDETIIEGIATNIPLLKSILNNKQFQDEEVSIKFLDQYCDL